MQLDRRIAGIRGWLFSLLPGYTNFSIPDVQFRRSAAEQVDRLQKTECCLSMPALEWQESALFLTIRYRLVGTGTRDASDAE